MPWMIRWPGGFPVFAAEAHGARFTDVDGHEYVDFCLGDTAAMTGHSPKPPPSWCEARSRRRRSIRSVELARPDVAEPIRWVKP